MTNSLRTVAVSYTDHDATTTRANFASWSEALDFATTYGVGADAEVANSRNYLEV